MNGPVEIRGRGLAASCCAYLLRREGVPVSRVRATRPAVPAIVVSLATQELIAGVFQQPNLFQGFRRIERRVVAWGNRADVELPHAAVVLAEEELLARVEALADGVVAEPAVWTVFGARPLPEPASEQRLGSRQAWAAAVELQEPETATCWIESLECGWLFLIPGWLIAVGGAPETLLAGSRVVAAQIRGLRGESAQFPAYPRIADPLAGPGWLACGAAAMAFDPICGDGAGNSVREAILAAAVIRAATRGEPAERLIEHYRSRLIAGFRRHLELSLQFYRAAQGGPWWEREIQAMERGLAWCAGQLADAPAFRYRLEGFDLLPVIGR